MSIEEMNNAAHRAPALRAQGGGRQCSSALCCGLLGGGDGRSVRSSFHSDLQLVPRLAPIAEDACPQC